ncbi:tRNA guanosine-2'-O-methyltransferase [Pleurotus eryngii]|uniref:tRNA (guanine(10)-N(2))-methyltransferase n=1 Tax=Pleurotus eryngii TaxID=5323 RepID=A0A9P6DKH8_PLEER|nr:tRNA guanosine-2'-O-methyltransferase [Pleurotus eryngii]
MPTKYLVVFAQSHSDFRIPELKSIAELYGFPLLLPDPCDPNRPFMVIELDQEEHARSLAKRCILIKSIHEFYGQGDNYDQLHAAVRKNQALWEQYKQDTSFRFSVAAYNHSITKSRQREVMESFGYMEFLGRIDLKSPTIVLGCYEEYGDTRGKEFSNKVVDGQFRQVYFGRLIEEGSARALIARFDVKKRVYFGNTSMEAEISLLMANQCLSRPGSLVYDPFMGTGSMAYPTSHFGSFVVGSDIDGRQMRGKGKQAGVLRAAAQYGTAHRIVDLLTFDVTRNPWRCGGLFDAIVTDPPYGVRAGAKRLGRRRSPTAKQLEAYSEHQAAPRPADQPYIPPTKPYELSELARDLVVLARYLLKPEGRLVFFLPTVNDEYEDVDIHSMLCEGMKLIANSLQDFGSWGRRLVTIKKVTSNTYAVPFSDNSGRSQSAVQHEPAHKDFREKYFQGFRKGSTSLDDGVVQ